MKSYALVLLIALFGYFSAFGQYHYEKNSNLSQKQIQQIISKIRKAYYQMKSAQPDEEQQQTIINFNISSGPQIPVIGSYQINFSYNVEQGFATGQTIRAASQKYYELFYMPWGLAFVYEKNDVGEQMRIYLYKGKIIKAYTKDEDGQITDGVDLDVDYSQIDSTLQELNTLYQNMCGCSDDDE